MVTVPRNGSVSENMVVPGRDLHHVVSDPDIAV